MTERRKMTEYVYEIKPASPVSEQIVVYSLFLPFPERQDIQHVISEFVRSEIDDADEEFYEFTITETLHTHEVLHEQTFTHNQRELQADGDAITLQRLTQEQAEDIIRREKLATFWISPSGRNPLQEGLRMFLSENDLEEKTVYGVRHTRFSLRLRLTNEVHFNRADNAPFDFYHIEEEDSE